MLRVCACAQLRLVAAERQVKNLEWEAEVRVCVGGLNAHILRST